MEDQILQGSLTAVLISLGKMLELAIIYTYRFYFTVLGIYEFLYHKNEFITISNRTLNYLSF